MNQREVDDFLEHFGVKGMHWGVRKDRSSGGSSAPRKAASSTRPSDSEIMKARENQLANRAAVKAAKKSKDNEAVQKAIDTFNNSPDRITGAHLTTGEQAMAVVLGSFGRGAAATSAANAAAELSLGKRYAAAIQDNSLGSFAALGPAHRVKKLQNAAASA